MDSVKACAIIRTEKIKSVRALRGCFAHNTRAQDVPNADKAREHMNWLPKGFRTISECMAKFERALGDHKPRSNAVLAREIIVTASPELMGEMTRAQQDEYFAAAFKWLNGVMGGKENVISASIHRDESTVHAHFVYACMVDGKLNDRALLGGHKSRLSQFQTDFYRFVGSKFGMTRGVVKSNAKHKPSKEYLGELEREIRDAEAQLDKLKKEIRHGVNYVKPSLIERLREVYGLCMSSTGEVTEVTPDVGVKNVPQTEDCENRRVERAFTPRW